MLRPTPSLGVTLFDEELHGHMMRGADTFLRSRMEYFSRLVNDIF